MLPEIEAWRLFAEEVESRLWEQNAAGYTGWDGGYPSESLARELTDDAMSLERGKGTRLTCVDVAARAMMLHRRIDY